MPDYKLTGWRRQRPDPRDWHFALPPRLTAVLPPAFSLAPNMPAHLDQGAEGSCGPTAASEMVQYCQKAEGLAVVPPSRQGIYWATRYLMGTVGRDSGVDNRTLLKALATYGFWPESDWPYTAADFPARPPDALWAKGQANRVSSYAAVAKQLDQMKGCILAGHPFLFGFEVFAGIESDGAAETGVVPDPGPGETPVGGHDLTAYAWDDARQAFRMRNHWTAGGRPWGDGGDAWVSYAYATGPHASDFWALNAVPGGAPAPPAPPPGGPWTLAIDRLFALVEQAEAGSPAAVAALKDVNVLADLILAGR